MSSESLAALLLGVAEVEALRNHYPVPRGIATGTGAVAAKAHGRACVVLLCSHYERYLYSVNEEAIGWINGQGCNVDAIPVRLRLQHSRAAVEGLRDTGWVNREMQLRRFITVDGPLWTTGGKTGTLNHEELIVWMKSPKPMDVTRFYRQFGIENIFEKITRAERRRRDLIFDLKELVEKRNNIAHGDTQTEALPSDVTRYQRSVAKFSRSADLVLARAIRGMAAAQSPPW